MLSINTQPTLLIVEDDAYWSNHYQVALKQIPIDILSAQAVKDGNTLLSRRSFSGVIVDLELPGLKGQALGGFEVIDYAFRRNPYTELLVITGHKTAEILDRVSRMGVRYITKPVDHRELVISVHAMVTAWERRFTDIQRILAQFSTTALIMQDRRHKKPNFEVKDEYDLQDLLHFQYKALFSDVVTEEYSLKRAGKSKRLDLVFKGLETVVETKLVRSKDHGKEIPDELDIDIRGYVAHPHCRHLICYVFDPHKYIKDPVSIEQDLSGEHSQDSRTMNVLVMIRPQ